MELKNFLKKEGISVKSLSNKTKIPYSTLNDLINGKTNIDNMRFGFVRKIAAALSLDINNICEMCQNELPVLQDGVIFVKNKMYYLRYYSADDEKETALCKVTKDSSRFIKDIAEWEMENIREEEMVKSWRNPSTL